MSTNPPDFSIRYEQLVNDRWQAVDFGPSTNEAATRLHYDSLADQASGGRIRNIRLIRRAEEVIAQQP